MLMLASTAQAQPDGWPWAANTGGQANAWLSLRDTWAPIQQWHTGLWWRCKAAGIAPPRWVETFAIAGTNYTVTNCLGTFVRGSVTGHPPVTATMWDALESKHEAVIPYYLATNAADADGSIDGWLLVHKALPNWAPWLLPWESKAGLFARHGLGRVTGTETNSTGFVTGGTCAWTRVRQHQQAPSIVMGAAHRTVTRVSATNFPGGSPPNGAYDRAGARWTQPASPDDWHVVWSSAAQRWELREDDGLFTTYFLPARRFPDGATNEWTDRDGGDVSTGSTSITTGWWFRAGSDLDNQQASTSTRILGPTLPVLHYTAPSGSLPTTVVTITGQAVATNQAWTPSGLAAGAYTASETVTTATEYVQLGLAWLRVTNMVAAGATEFAAGVSVLYTNLSLAGPGGRTLLASVLDERIAALLPLRWTVRAASYVATNTWYGDDDQALSGAWADSKATSIVNYAVASLTNSALWLQSYTLGQGYEISVPPIPTYYSRINMSAFVLTVSNVWSGIDRDIDAYCVVYGPPGAGVTNADGSATYYNPALTVSRSNEFARFWSWANVSAIATSTPSIGDVSALTAGDARWASEPSTNGSVHRKGYRVGAFGDAIIKWQFPW